VIEYACATGKELERGSLFITQSFTCPGEEICSDGRCVAGEKKKACSDGIDNDLDKLIDKEDPGCWKDNKKESYDPNLDDEARAGIVCSINSDCGTDGLSKEKFCKDNVVHQMYESFVCKNPGTTAAACITNKEPRAIQTCSSDQLCLEGECKGQCADKNDNDLDGKIDENDEDCRDNKDNPKTYNKNLKEKTPVKKACAKSNDCGISTTEIVCIDETQLCSRTISYVCNNPDTVQSSCTKQALKNSCTTCEYGCENNACVAPPAQSTSERVSSRSTESQTESKTPVQITEVIREKSKPIQKVLKTIPEQIKPAVKKIQDIGSVMNVKTDYLFITLSIIGLCIVIIIIILLRRQKNKKNYGFYV
jgi:hypothetical protein